MKHWIKRSLFGLLGASVVLGGLAACSHRGERGWADSPEQAAKFKEKMVDRVSDKLALNAEQKAKLAIVADKVQQQRQALVSGQADPRAAVQALVAGNKFDRAGATALVASKTEAVATKSPEVITALADFYDSLNAEQQGKVREFMQKRRGWRGS